MVAFLKRLIPNSRLRVKEVVLPLATTPLLGSGIDVMTLPEGHFSCVGCKGYRFECSMLLDNRRLEAGCMSCGSSYRFLFPIDCPLPEASGRFSCFSHRDKGMVIIHNVGKLCVGCECCKTQIVFDLDTKSNLIIPDA